MALDLMKILDDDKTFADGIEIVVNGEKGTLADLRGMSRKKQQELADRMKATEDKFTEVTNLATQAAALKQQLDEQLAKVGKEKNPPTDDELDTDPFWAPVKKRYGTVDATVKELKDTVTKLGAAAERMATIWAQDRWRGQFDRLAPKLAKSSKHKDMTFEKVREFAATNKLLDEYGFPSVEKAIVELTRDEDFETRLAEARQQGIKEGETRGRLAASGRPTSATGPKKPEKSMVAEKGLEGLGDDVAADPELSKMLADLGAANPDEFGAPV